MSHCLFCPYYKASARNYLLMWFMIQYLITCPENDGQIFLFISIRYFVICDNIFSNKFLLKFEKKTALLNMHQSWRSSWHLDVVRWTYWPDARFKICWCWPLRSVANKVADELINSQKFTHIVSWGILHQTDWAIHDTFSPLNWTGSYRAIAKKRQDCTV